MTARRIIDSYFRRDSHEYSFETHGTVSGVEDVELVVTYVGERHSDEDRKLTGFSGETKVQSIVAKDNPERDVSKELTAADHRRIETEVIEHYEEHHTDHDEDHLDL